MSLINTYLQQIRTEFPQPIQRDEWRFTRYGMLTAVVEMTESAESLITQDLKEKAMNSEGRDLGIPVMDIGDDVVLKNQRSCTISDLENTTQIITLNWSTFVADISMCPAEYKKNEVKYLQDLNAKLKKVDNALCKGVEDLIFAKLDTDKSGIYNSALVGTDYPLTGNALQVTQAQQEFFFNDLMTIMNEDDFYADSYKILASTGMMSPVNKFINQGAGNDTNTNFQFAGLDFRFSNHHVVGAGNRSSAFVMPNGSIGILSRIAVDSLEGHKSTTGHEWGTMKLEKFPFEIGYLYKSECTDKSATVGQEHLEATLKENWQLSVDIGLVTSYNSDPATKAGAIKKFEFQ